MIFELIFVTLLTLGGGGARVSQVTHFCGMFLSKRVKTVMTGRVEPSQETPLIDRNPQQMMKLLDLRLRSKWEPKFKAESMSHALSLGSEQLLPSGL